MNKRSKKSKEQAPSDGWRFNQKDHTAIDQYFAGSKGGMPNNPLNARSYEPSDWVNRTNPYRDAFQSSEGEHPVFVKPNQRGSSFSPPPVPVEKPGKVIPPKEARRGMSTGVGLMNSGPKRNVPLDDSVQLPDGVFKSFGV